MDRHELAVAPRTPRSLYNCLEEEARRRQTSKAEFIRELLSQACNEGEKK